MMVPSTRPPANLRQPGHARRAIQLTGVTSPCAALLVAFTACAPAEDGGNNAVTVIENNADGPAPSDNPDGPGAPPIIGAPTDSDIELLEAPPPATCGNGALDAEEQCDDGGVAPDDGCSANCLVVEQGWECPTAGVPCQRAEVCGDALLVGNESCDDGNDTAEDGCSAACQLEADYLCPQPGEPCVSQVICGDGLIAGAETCDDGNLTNGDGCSDTCVLTEGFECPIRGALCVPICGDGLVRGQEQCDDGGVVPADGCNATCGRETGFVCRTAGEACARTVCGDQQVEGDETCDDGLNDVPFDGCFQCVAEPECNEGECGAVCGDGLRFDTEACDDGNTQDGDGCSSACEFESGFLCLDAGGDGGTGDTFVLPVIYRDFIGTDTAGDGLEAVRLADRATAGVVQHEDFNAFGGSGVLGAVDGQLGGGKPVFACGADNAAANALCGTNFTTEENFDQWYRTTPLVNRELVDSLTLGALANGSFQFDSALTFPDGTANAAERQFNPISGLGWTVPLAIAGEAETIYEGEEFCAIDQIANPNDANATPRNMSFTTETRFVFEYQGGETFEFSGDDDVWVYVNNRLVVDLGGLHEVATGEFSLSALAATQGIATVERLGPLNSELTTIAPVEIDTDMVLGNVYEVALFHAERAECGSNFKLTLNGFDKPKSACNEVCGDGVVTRSETCDEGAANGEGYGLCGTDCTPGPRCGDGLVEPGEEICDNGFNVDVYSNDAESGACGPGCTATSFCGDGIVDSVFTEECDNGPADAPADGSLVGNDGSYDGCTPDCKLGPRCGDGAINGEEECDDGNRVNGDGCNLTCETETVLVPA